MLLKYEILNCERLGIDCFIPCWCLSQKGIDEVLRTGTASIAPADIKIIRAIAAEYAKDIFRRLREYGYDEGTMMLYVTGGGGCLVNNFYKFNADRVKFVDDICAAAKGYEYMAELQVKAGN